MASGSPKIAYKTLKSEQQDGASGVKGVQARPAPCGRVSKAAHLYGVRGHTPSADAVALQSQPASFAASVSTRTRVARRATLWSGDLPR
jgi:hypothetical protein